MSKIVLKNVYKVYEGGVRAVSNFNLEIKDKEFIVFVGPSGCGKSTTLRMIAGLEEITSGDLYMDGARVNDVEPKDRNIAMVFQSYALYPHMSVFQNMAFGLKLRKTDKDEITRKVTNAAKILGIEDLLNRKPKALSGGQRQRVALGRAIVREPNVFLLDEPLSNLDAKLRVAMRVEITKLQKRLSTTFIYVTHDQTEAMTMGDRIVVMKDGIMQQVDSPAAIYEQPRNVFVATFLGSPQMNILNVKLVKDDKGLGVLLGNNQVVYYEGNKAKQLISESYINKEILFGIRPENISLDNKGIEANIDAIEHLGSETILYCKVSGIEESIIAKIPSNYTLVANQKVFLHFDMVKSHGFDIDTQNSILGVPSLNRIKVEYKNNKLQFGKNVIDNESTLIKHTFTSRLAKSKYMYIDVTKVTEEIEKESVKVDAKIDFIIQGNDNVTYYCKIDGLDDYFVFRSNTKEHNENDMVSLYLPIEDLSLVDDSGLRITSKEEVSENVAHVSVKNVNGQTHINVGGTTLKYNDLKVEDGNYKLFLHEFGLSVGYSKSFAKEAKIDRNVKDNSLVAKAYDEDKLSDNDNCIYVKLPGFDNYITTVVNNDFSVYKMPIFKLNIESKDFDLIKE